MTAILDDFNTGALQALSTRAGWGTGHWSGTTDLQTDAVPTKATTGLGVPAGNIWASNYGTDHESMFTFGAAISTTQLLARVNSTTAPSQGYVGYVTGFNNFEIQTRAGATLVANAAGPTAASGDSFRLACVGATIMLDYRPVGNAWGSLLAVNDTTYTTGTFIGVHVSSGAPDIDEFGGGAIVPDAALAGINLLRKGDRRA